MLTVEMTIFDMPFLLLSGRSIGPLRAWRCRSPSHAAGARPKIDCNAINGYNAAIADQRLDVMASITIRKLDETTKARLRVRAAHHKRSMEEEARHILRTALADAPRIENLAEAIRSRFKALGGIDLELPARGTIRKPPKPAAR